MRKRKTNADGVPIFRLESGQIVTAPDNVFLALREMPVNRYTWEACRSPETAKILSLDPPVLYARVGWRPMSTAPKDGDREVLLIWQPPEPPGAEPTVVLTSWICRTHVHLAFQRNCPNEKDCDLGWGHYAGEMLGWQPPPEVGELP